MSRFSPWPLPPNCYTWSKNYRCKKKGEFQAEEYLRINHCRILGSQIGISFSQSGVPGTQKIQTCLGCFTTFFPFKLKWIRIGISRCYFLTIQPTYVELVHHGAEFFKCFSRCSFSPVEFFLDFFGHFSGKFLRNSCWKIRCVTTHISYFLLPWKVECKRSTYCSAPTTICM